MMKPIILFFGCLIVTTTVSAQNRPSFSSMYFQHPYLANPAMAGKDSGITVYAVHQQLISGADAAPNAQALAVTYRLKGFRFGVQAGNNRYGLFNTVGVRASISYSQPLGDAGETLHFGIAYGGYGSHIRSKDVEGDSDDPMVQQFNGRKVSYDGDLGLAYTDNHLTVQIAVPDFTTAFNKNREDLSGRMQLYTTVSYMLDISSLPGTTLTPLAGYRLVKDENGITDLGARLYFAQYRFGLEGIYHTSSSVTAGLTIAILPHLSVQCMYSSEPSVVRTYTNGNIEIGLKAGF